MKLRSRPLTSSQPLPLSPLAALAHLVFELVGFKIGRAVNCRYVAFPRSHQMFGWSTKNLKPSSWRFDCTSFFSAWHVIMLFVCYSHLFHCRMPHSVWPCGVDADIMCWTRDGGGCRGSTLHSREDELSRNLGTLLGSQTSAYRAAQTRCR